MRVNYLGTFHCLHAVGKVMVRQRAGRIINLTTVAVPLSLEGEAAYVASKAAVEALTRAVPGGKLAEINQRIGRPVGTTVPQAVDFLVALIGDASVSSGSVRYLASF